MKKFTIFTVALSLIIGASSFTFAYEPGVDDVTPTEAYELATTDPNVFILDVRTAAEWVWVGHPGPNKLAEGEELAGKVINISYKVEKKGELILNKKFVRDVKRFLEDNPDAILISMCRSGGRSVAAAELLEEEGYYNILNMLTGFQGGKSEDGRGYRTKNGWVVDGKPYTFGYSGVYSTKCKR